MNILFSSNIKPEDQILVRNMRKAKRMPGIKKEDEKEDKYIGPMTAVEVTDSHAVVLKKGSDSKCTKYPLHISRQYFPRSEAKLTKRKCTDLPTYVATKKLKVEITCTSTL